MIRKIYLASAVLVLLLLVAAARFQHVGAQSPRAVSVVVTDPSHSVLAADAPGGKRTVLSPGLAAVRDPEASFDGTHLLFAGQASPGKPWQIWEVAADGGAPRAVTGETADCDQPHYLPGDRAVFRRTGAGGEPTLCAVPLVGGKTETLTFGAEEIRDSLVLPDGRIAYGSGKAWITVNNDGTGVAAYTGRPEDLAATRTQVAGALSPLGPRPVPTGHVSVIDAKKRPTGLLFCLNTYLSDRPEFAGVRDGQIANVRIWAKTPQPHVLGEAPVAADGSFFLETPPDTALRMELLGRDGKTLGKSCRWIWMRANESRGCIGCHESTALAPENEVPLATRKPPFSLVAAAPGKS